MKCGNHVLKFSTALALCLTAAACIAQEQEERGKIIVVEENGEQREIDVSGAQSIIINKSASSVIRDGEEQQQFSGKAIIIGPDGQKQEFELAVDPLNSGMTNFRFAPVEGEMWRAPGGLLRLPGKLKTGPLGTENQFAIGVHCQPIDDSLRAHVDLEDGVGLLVVNVPVAESPAGEAGIQKHDILTYANQTQLSALADLVAAVQEAGAGSKPLALKLLRKGQQVDVEVTPTERKSLLPPVQATMRWAQPGHVVEMEEFGPGLIQGDANNALLEKLMKKMEEMDAQFEQRMGDFKALREELNNALRKDGDNN